MGAALGIQRAAVGAALGLQRAVAKTTRRKHAVINSLACNHYEMHAGSLQKMSPDTQRKWRELSGTGRQEEGGP